VAFLRAERRCRVIYKRRPIDIRVVMVWFHRMVFSTQQHWTLLFHKAANHPAQQCKVITLTDGRQIPLMSFYHSSAIYMLDPSDNSIELVPVYDDGKWNDDVLERRNLTQLRY
jgi:hypothetical protein